MNHSMLEALRSRAPLLLLSLALLGLLRPTPNYRPLQQALAQARRAARLGDPAATLERLEWALDFDPQLASLHLAAARYALAAGQLDKAALHLDRARAADLPAEAVQCATLELRLAQNDPPGALAAWSAAPDRCAAQVATLERLSEALWEMGELQDAEKVLQVLMHSEPNHPLAARLALLQAVQDPQAALQTLRALDPPPAERPLALALRQHLAGMDPQQPLAQQLALVGKFYAQQGRWQLAKLAFRNAVTLVPNYAEALAYLGLATNQTGGSGLGALYQAARLRPNDPTVHLLLGMHWITAGEPQLAVQEIEQAARLDPDNPHIAAQMGAAYEALGEPQTALQAYEVATQLAPQDPTFWVLLARASLRLSADIQARAMPAARRALLLDPSNPQALDSLGMAYLMLEDYPMAERFLRRALARDPRLPEAHYHLGLLYAAQGQWQAARAALLQAAQLDPQGQTGALARRSLENLFP